MKYVMYNNDRMIGEYTNRVDVLIARRAILNRTRYKNKNVCVRRVKGMRHTSIVILRIHNKTNQVFKCTHIYNRHSTDYPRIYPWWYIRVDTRMVNGIEVTTNDYFGRWWYEV